MPKKFNIQKFEERILRFNNCAITKLFFEKFDDCYTESVQNRIKAATYNNLLRYYKYLEKISNQYFGDEDVISFCMPVSPYVTFHDIFQYSQVDSRLRSFTSINPCVGIEQACKEINLEVNDCYGLKLHPIIQGIPFDSDLTYSVLDIFKKLQKPVLFHAGASRYYLGKERINHHCELDSVDAAFKMVSKYKEIPFIIGHAGIAEYNDWAKKMSKLENTFFDITVQSSTNIKKLISLYGEDKMLFASDWPCVDPKTTVEIVKKSLTDSQLEKCMFKNAMLLFKI